MGRGGEYGLLSCGPIFYDSIVRKIIKSYRPELPLITLKKCLDVMFMLSQYSKEQIDTKLINA